MLLILYSSFLTNFTIVSLRAMCKVVWKSAIDAFYLLPRFRTHWFFFLISFIISVDTLVDRIGFFFCGTYGRFPGAGFT